eukprot:gene1520-2037_t
MRAAHGFELELPGQRALGLGPCHAFGLRRVDVVEAAKEHIGVDAEGRIADGDLRTRISAHKMDAAAFALTIRRAEQEAKASKGPSAATSIIKYAAAKLNQERTELTVEALGLQGLGWEGEQFSAGEIGAMRSMLRAKANSIEGGTSEINLNVVAKRVLVNFFASAISGPLRG